MEPQATDNILTPAIEPGEGVEVQQLFDLHPYQRRAVENPARFTWNNWSRQVGKSYAFSLRRIIRGLARGRNQLFLSAGERQSRELMLKAQGHLRKLKVGFDLAERDFFEGTRFTAMEITVPDPGIRIIGLPANPSTARGFTGDVLLDEFAMHGTQDTAIYAAAYGSVTRNRGELDVCSTPKGRTNMFYRLGTNPVFDRSTLTIEDAVADGLDVDIAELRAGLYDAMLWHQEYMCDFVDEASAFLTYELIGSCENATLKRDLDLAALADRDKGDVYVGVDVGRERNPTVIWAFERTGNRLTHLGIIEMVGAPFREQFDRLSNVLRCKCVRRCCIDKGGLGMQLAEQTVQDFGEHRVEAVLFTPALKEELAGNVLIKMQDSNVLIPVCDRIRNDLHSIQRSVTSAGHVRYQAPQTGGEHADRFWSLALAIHAATTPGGKIEVELGPARAIAGSRRYIGGERVVVW